MCALPKGFPGQAPPSGQQFVIQKPGIKAVVTEVGASLRRLSIGGVPVVWGYGVDSMSTGGRGQLLAPWPNRIEDGTYSFEGVAGHVPIDEPERRNAIHGLVRWLVWDLVERSGERVVLSCELAPQPAYPWRLAIEVSYEVGEDGLVVEATAENRSTLAAPFGMGAHPYLHGGPLGADGCTLRLPATRSLVLNDRGLPVGSGDVRASDNDFRSGRCLAGVNLDDCFTALAPAVGEQLRDGAAWQATLTRADGSGVVLWADSAWPYVMCYTGDTLAPKDRRRGVAIEPMTCPPNALRSGESLLRLDPGEKWSGRFGLGQPADTRRTAE